MAKTFFDHIDVEIACVIDQNPDACRSDPAWHGISILHPDQADSRLKRNALLVICIATMPLIELMSELKIIWSHVCLFYDLAENYSGKTPIGNGWLFNQATDREKKSIAKVYSLLADDHSRLHYLVFLAWRIARIEIIPTGFPVDLTNRFFIPQVIQHLGKDEIFADCGAHQGFVLKKFLSLVQNKFNKIYAFEPDAINFNACCNEFGHIPGISLIQAALGEKKQTECFYEGFGFASKIDPSGKAKVEMTTLDGLNTKATFIKMHIEGKELQALKGACNTISEQRPVTAVTIYHNADGLWRIPLFFMENFKDYLILVRSHSWAGTGAILYAIPAQSRGTKRS